ncbi:MAG: SDR family NAD(P)-dependent oxidoreductase [Prolixibacteraceae bacterium]
MEKEISGKSKHYTLITGATAGIGEQIAVECAKRGMNLFLVSLPETGIEELADDLQRKYAVEVWTLAVDLTEYEAPQMVYDFAQKHQLTVNILVNNAGVGFGGEFEKLDTNLTDKMILLNVRATTLLAVLFLPEMKKLEKAYLLNMSSFAAFSPVPFKSVYSASKSYLFFLTQALNKELKDTNVKITSIHPTGVQSKRTAETIKNGSYMTKLSSLSPEEVAQTAIKNMLNGKKFIVPGMVSKLYYFLGSILPHGLILRLAGTIFRKSAGKSAK